MVIASGVAFVVLSAALLLPNYDSIVQVTTSDSVNLGVKLSFLASLYGSLITNFTLISAGYLLTTAILFGINISLLIYYIRRQQVKSDNIAAHLTSLGGIVSATFGIGCAACGSIILTALLTTFGAGGLILWLPFHGVEFSVLGIILLCFSVYYLSKKISNPLVCSSI